MGFIFNEQGEGPKYVCSTCGTKKKKADRGWRYDGASKKMSCPQHNSGKPEDEVSMRGVFKTKPKL